VQKRNEIVALFLTDQRMPSMTGIDFLEKARTIFLMQKVLLTAYADTEATINSINSIQLDYYLMKPWDPPEDHLYPVLDDLLEEWRANIKLPYEGIRVAGTQWSPRSHDVKDFLARHQIAYQWLDIDRDPTARSLVEQQFEGEPKIPVIFLSDGKVLIDPGFVSLLTGWDSRAGVPASYDLVIVGAGPARFSMPLFMVPRRNSLLGH
jgi:thioredoxin reductase (NADPH)